MERSKECPLCAESMRLVVREHVDIIPGSGRSATRTTREWVCPDCDYFEEAEEEDEQK
jgi:C4-type Zn-finger protein